MPAQKPATRGPSLPHAADAGRGGGRARGAAAATPDGGGGAAPAQGHRLRQAPHRHHLRLRGTHPPTPPRETLARLSRRARARPVRVLPSSSPELP